MQVHHYLISSLPPSLPPSPPLPQTFKCSADDLKEESELGRGAYGSVYQMRHKQTSTVMAVKVCVCECVWGCVSVWVGGWVWGCVGGWVGVGVCRRYTLVIHSFDLTVLICKEPCVV